MIDKKAALAEEVVVKATELGIEVVKDVMRQSLLQSPSMPLRQFQAVLDAYLAQVKRDLHNKIIEL